MRHALGCPEALRWSLECTEEPKACTLLGAGALPSTPDGLCSALQGNGSGSAEVEYYGKNFEFLSLGVMAYVGGDQAVTQLEAGKARTHAPHTGECSLQLTCRRWA